jgi:hypothetical protein
MALLIRLFFGLITFQGFLGDRRTRVVSRVLDVPVIFPFERISSLLPPYLSIRRVALH